MRYLVWNSKEELFEVKERFIPRIAPFDIQEHVIRGKKEIDFDMILLLKEEE